MTQEEFVALSGVGTAEFVGRARLHLGEELLDAEMTAAAGRGEHYWMATMGYRVTPPVPDGYLFDAATLRLYAIGCFICEEPYSDRLVHRKCKGDPDS